MQSSQGLRCRDNNADRTIGQYWQDRFVEMAVQFGCVVEDKQKGKHSSAVAKSHAGGVILPDVQISKRGVTVLPEIKHKDPTRHGQYGYEQYRLADLVEYANATGLEVIVAIHDHSLAGGKHVKQNRLQDWRWQDVLVLAEEFDCKAAGYTWYAGERVVREIVYWDVARFEPLSTHAFFQPCDFNAAGSRINEVQKRIF